MAETSYGLLFGRQAAMVLNAFPPKDRARIRSTLGHLIGPTALEELGGRVRHLPTDEPLYSVRVPPDIRIIFSRQGDMITIVNILRQGTIEAFAAEFGPQGARQRTKLADRDSSGVTPWASQSGPYRVIVDEATGADHSRSQSLSG